MNQPLPNAFDLLKLVSLFMFTRFQASETVCLSNAPFWHVAPLMLVVVDRRFGTACRFHLQGSSWDR